jgi:two-component system, LytTR family, response regulator
MIQTAYKQQSVQPALAVSLLLNTSRGAVAINVNHVVRIAASSSYSKLFFFDGKTLVVPKVLKWFEQHLTGGSFLRIHRTHLINKQFISNYCAQSGKLVLTNSEWLAVSRRRKAQCSGIAVP